MLQKAVEVLMMVLLSPLLAVAKATAARQSADAVADLLRRADQAQADNMPDLAAQLRATAASLSVDGKADQLLPPPDANGHAASLPAPKRLGRPRKEQQQ